MHTRIEMTNSDHFIQDDFKITFIEQMNESIYIFQTAQFCLESFMSVAVILIFILVFVVKTKQNKTEKMISLLTN